MRTALLAPLLVVHLALACAAGASTVDDICSPPGTPQGTKPCACTTSPLRCRVTKIAAVTSPSTLDFGARTLEVAQGAKIDAGALGLLTVIAASVDLQPGSGLLAAGGDITVQTTGDISIRKSGTSVARIDVSGPTASSITVQSSDGNVLIEGTLDAASTVIDQFAGDITVRGRNVVAPGEFDIHAGRSGLSGTVGIDTVLLPPDVGGNIVFSGKVDGTAGEASSGNVDLSADGDVTCTALVDLQGTQEGGSGGSLDISAGGMATLGGTVRTSGTSSTSGDTDKIGDAGDVTVDAVGSIVLNGILDLSGPPSGLGGSATFTSGLDITQTGSIDVHGRGINGSGNEAVFEADRAITLGAIVATGGDNGSGGLVDATALCNLTVPAGKTLDTRGPDGDIVLASGGTMTIAGTLRATHGNELDYLSTPPVVTGSLVPAVPGAVQVSGLVPCGGFPPTGCGDGVRQAPGEECDGSDDADCPGKCSASCTCVVCGNGRPEGNEVCDDGNTLDCVGTCHSDCSRQDDICGDGHIECGETCEDQPPNTTPGDGCSGTCQVEECGNGVRDEGEECDDGAMNGDPTSGCDANCKAKAPAGCGNGEPDPGEACDDGNQTDCDGCSHLCQIDGCGSGTIDANCGETCDDLNTTRGDGCSDTCQIEECGNGVQDEGEECDAGPANGQPDAGCSTICTREFCGNNTVEAGEECDTGAQNGQPGTPCSSGCRLHWCGDGVVDAGEVCDLGAQNGAPGAGCRADVCRPGTLCTAPAADGCIPCADTLDCDPLRACGASACVAGVCTPVAPPDCDDGNACTDDRCDPATGCVSTPVVCQDSTACDGTLSCNPATGQCVNGPAPDCDDDDECTDDTCIESAPGATCRNALRPGLDGATCRLASLQALIESASDIPKKTRKKLRAKTKGVAKKLPKAAGTGRKATKARKQISNGLKAISRMVSKAQSKLAPETVTRLNTAISDATVAVGNL